MRIVLVCTVLAVAAAASGAARPVARHPGFPIIACDDSRYPYANHYGRVYRPAGVCRTSRGNGIEGIDHTRWATWGGAQARGRGYLVVYDGPVEEYPATITAGGLWTTSHFLGGNGYFAAYTHLKVHVLVHWRGARELTLQFPVQE